MKLLDSGVSVCAWIAALASMVTLASCGRAASETPRVIVRDSAGVSVVTSLLPKWSEGEEWHVSARPDLWVGGASVPFGVITAVASAPDGRIVVAEERPVRIRVFSPDGAPRRTFGRKGEGPVANF